MKKILPQLVTLLFTIPFWSSAQPGFQKGFILTAGNEKTEGLIKQSLHSKGTIVFLSPDVSKKTFSATDINGFNLDGVNYISWLNDFFKEVSFGKICLYQKVTDNKDILIYNGPEVVGFMKTTEGKRGEYYIRWNTEENLTLISKKHFQESFTALFENNNLQKEIRNKSLGYADIVKIVELYNNTGITN